MEAKTRAEVLLSIDGVPEDTLISSRVIAAARRRRAHCCLALHARPRSPSLSEADVENHTSAPGPDSRLPGIETGARLMSANLDNAVRLAGADVARRDKTPATRRAKLAVAGWAVTIVSDDSSTLYFARWGNVRTLRSIGDLTLFTVQGVGHQL